MANAKFRSSQLLELVVDSDSDDGLSGGLTRPSAAKSTKAKLNNKTNGNSKVNNITSETAKMPPAKRGRQPAATNKVTKPAQKTTKASARGGAPNERIAAAVEEQLKEDSGTAPLAEKSTNVQPKATTTGRGRKRAAAAAASSEEEQTVEDVEMEDAPVPAPKASRGRPKRAALEEVPDSQPPPPARGGQRGRKKAKQPEPVVEEEDEEDEMHETTEIPETQQPQNMTVIEEEQEEEEDEQQHTEDLLRARKSSSAELLRGRGSGNIATTSLSPSKSRPIYGSASPNKTTSDPALRRRLGEMTQKYEYLEQKYQNLREIAVKEAESNFEKLRKQTDEKSRVAEQLIASLKAEIAAQKEASKELPRLQKQLEASEAKAASLEAKNAELATSLAESKTEIKALNMKLTAARTAEAAAAAKSVAAGVPGSAVKGTSSRMNGHMMMGASNPEAVRQATLKGQKREDLYADLTGLIIRTIPSNNTGNGKDDAGGGAGDVVYDCIQTGKNGTLHFKLRECDDLESPGEEPQLRYMPQLDPDRDRGLMEILPNFLVDEIEFPRSHVDKFYARVVKALTGA